MWVGGNVLVPLNVSPWLSKINENQMIIQWCSSQMLKEIHHATNW